MAVKWLSMAVNGCQAALGGSWNGLQDVAPFPVLIPPSALAVGDGGGAAVGAALEGGGEPPA